MADVEVTCSKCGKTVTISQFVDRTNLKCRECGTPLEVPAPPEERPKPKVQPPKEKDGNPLFEPPPEPTQKELRKAARKRHSKLAGKTNHAIIAAILFVVLGAAAGLLRYGGLLPPHYLAFWRKEAIFVFLAFHILIVLKAVKESMFQAILALLVPGYSLYFAFFRCDDFYLRAVLAALLIGGGEDAFKVFGQYLKEAIAYVDYLLRWGER